MEQRISMITLGVNDLQRALRFYRDGLGWKPSSASNDNVVFIPVGGVVLGLYPKNALAEDAHLVPGGSGFGGIALAHNVRTKEEVAPVLERAQAAGGRLLKPAQDVFWGGHSGYFADPDGYPWEVAWNPFWEINEQGQVLLPS